MAMATITIVTRPVMVLKQKRRALLKIKAQKMKPPL